MKKLSDVPNLKKNSPQWFAFEEGYGSPDTYGPNIRYYQGAGEPLNEIYVKADATGAYNGS